jgi:hypothetical protein
MGWLAYFDLHTIAFRGCLREHERPTGCRLSKRGQLHSHGISVFVPRHLIHTEVELKADEELHKGVIFTLSMDHGMLQVISL